MLQDTGGSWDTHGRSLRPGMNRERDQPLADAEAAYLRAARYAEECRHRDAVGLAPSLLPRPGAVAVTVTTTALDRVMSGVVCGDACVPGFGRGLARESVGGVGFEVGL